MLLSDGKWNCLALCMPAPCLDIFVSNTSWFGTFARLQCTNFAIILWLMQIGGTMWKIKMHCMDKAMPIFLFEDLCAFHALSVEFKPTNF